MGSLSMKPARLPAHAQKESAPGSAPVERADET